MEFTMEQIARAMKAASAEELLTMAKEDGIDITLSEAEEYYSQLHQQCELSDEDLSIVAGGKGNVPKFGVGQTVYWKRMKTNCQICRIMMVNKEYLYDVKIKNQLGQYTYYDKVHESAFDDEKKAKSHS